jgi:hypothetical protein
MSVAVSCCQQLLTGSDRRFPFSRMVVLDYYDGEISGLVECSGCSAVYRFEMLDWDANKDILYAKPLFPQEGARKTRDWFSFLGLEKWPSSPASAHPHR